ncbi:pyruvate dehydrogenase E1 component subunit alpha, mitochondrial-like [Drosophila sulfurigaster albostrigata]|uniref:pyruvate dehydrogenase E1 component subunit alpha, mitochondrial-like n=1 Tax=Drosophila sulfurigaster albostrigata TaxID=89887 RepID=UPI002D21E3D1|nr:pyruvate dehydrogenase E1 component subunit alpha, mitochondrial-like [Drosophila sulfurigaster albostrigata]
MLSSMQRGLISTICDLMQQTTMHRAAHSRTAQQTRPQSQSQPQSQPKKEILPEDSCLVHLPIEFKLHRLEHGPDTLVSLKRKEASLYLRQLMALRRLEAAAAQLYKDQLVRGFCHLYTGQEACAVGVCAALRPQDNLIAGYRIHGWAYLHGRLSAQAVLAELTGRASGCARGKGGSMHMYARHFYGGNGIVGAQIPLGAGIALASKYQQLDAVCVALYGDGAANQGQLFESFNMAQLWKLPVVFVCENNNYGMGTSSWRASSNTNNYTRGDYLPGIWADGQDVLAVRSAIEFAIGYALQRGPLIVELCTYRYAGHSMSDCDSVYRSRDEVQEVRRRHDAVERFQRLCVDQQLLSAEQLQEIALEVRREMELAVKATKSDQELPLTHLWSDVYADNAMQGKIRGVLGQQLEHLRTTPGREKPTNCVPPKASLNT